MDIIPPTPKQEAQLFELASHVLENLPEDVVPVDDTFGATDVRVTGAQKRAWAYHFRIDGQLFRLTLQPMERLVL